MNKLRIIGELAFLDGYTDITFHENGVYIGEHPHRVSKCIPTYLTDHNAVQRLLEDLGNKQMLGTYVRKLQTIVGDGWVYELCTLATCEQKCKAILLTYGLWKEYE